MSEIDKARQLEVQGLRAMALGEWESAIETFGQAAVIVYVNLPLFSLVVFYFDESIDFAGAIEICFGFDFVATRSRNTDSMAETRPLDRSIHDVEVSFSVTEGLSLSRQFPRVEICLRRKWLSANKSQIPTTMGTTTLRKEKDKRRMKVTRKMETMVGSLFGIPETEDRPKISH